MIQRKRRAPYSIVYSRIRDRVPSCTLRYKTSCLFRDLNLLTPGRGTSRSDCFTAQISTLNLSKLMRQYLRKELACPIGLGMFEEGLFWPVLYDLSPIHEDHSIGDSLSETHLVSNH